MSEVLLDTIVRKVEAQDKKQDDLQKQVDSFHDHSETLKNINVRLDTTEAEIQDLPKKISFPLLEMTWLTNALEKNSKINSRPIKAEVRHEHHLSSPIWTLIVMSLVIIGLLFVEYYTWFQANQHKENDIKYRYLQVFQPPDGKKFLHQLDSQYTSNPDQFIKDVIQQEKIELDSFEDFQRAQENQQEINDINKKWGRKPGQKAH